MYMDMHKSFVLCFTESKGDIYELVVSRRKVFCWAGYFKVYINKDDQIWHFNSEPIRLLHMVYPFFYESEDNIKSYVRQVTAKDSSHTENLIKFYLWKLSWKLTYNVWLFIQFKSCGLFTEDHFCWIDKTHN